MKSPFKEGQVVTCINNQPLTGNDVAPPLKVGQQYIIKRIVYTGAENHAHLDVGLKSNYNYISCWQTSLPIPEGDKIHWCYPARFEEYVFEDATN